MFTSAQAGWAYVAFVLDVFSSIIVGRHVSTSLRTELSLWMPSTWACRHDSAPAKTSPASPITATADRAIRYSEWLAKTKAVASVVSKGDRYDNAMAEALNWLFEVECIRDPVMRPECGLRVSDRRRDAVAEYVD